MNIEQVCKSAPSKIEPINKSIRTFYKCQRFHTANLTPSDFYAGFHCLFLMHPKQVEVVDRTRSNTFSDKPHLILVKQNKICLHGNFN